VVASTLILSEGARTLVGYESVGQKIDRGIASINSMFADTGERVQNQATAAGDKVHDTGREIDRRTVAAFDAGAAKVDAAGNAVRQGAAALGTGMSDAAITTSIKTDLLKDPYLSAAKVEVDTEQGIVTLRGIAASDASRERAGHMAASIAGVRQVNNQLMVTSNTADAR
jgi:osmotically-inducible protein OsmY